MQDKKYPQIMKYNKLVRDKIPKIILNNNNTPVTHIASDKEYEAKLREKLQEEVDEFLKEPNAGEVADILEVLHALCDHYEICKKEVIETKHKKANKRGKFKEKIILEETR